LLQDRANDVCGQAHTDIAAGARAIARARTLGHDLLFTMSDNTHASSIDEACGMVFTDEQKPGVLHSTSGGARRDRTDDLLLAKQALSQLSYGPGPWQ
jgi:hypothetical protein